MDMMDVYILAFVVLFGAPLIVASILVNRRRCPWCGMRIKRSKGIRVMKKRTPKYLKFSQCGHCGYYYGQSLYSSYRGTIYGVAVLLFLALAAIFENILFVIPISPLLFLIATVPFVRLTEEEQTVELNVPKYRAKISQDSKIRKNNLYFFDKDFDSKPALSAVSPIEIHSVDRKNLTAVFSFIYVHPENDEVLKGMDYKVYNSGMKDAGKITVVGEVD